jgi:GNAT superfamily N-acetyltransferase
LPEAAETFGLRPLLAGDRLTSLKTGDAAFQPLSTFARRNAHRYEIENLARTYVVEHEADARLVAYITLVCSEVATDEDVPLVEGDGLNFPFDTYPAVKIARLLVDARWRGQGRSIGRNMVEFTLGVAREVICPRIGCRFVVVDSKKESVGFYEKCGFTIVNSPANRARPAPVMYVDLHKAGR